MSDELEAGPGGGSVLHERSSGVVPRTIAVSSRCLFCCKPAALATRRATRILPHESSHPRSSDSRPVVRSRRDRRQHDRRRHSAHAGRHRRRFCPARGCSSASGSSADCTRCSARTRSPSWARCCRAAAAQYVFARHAFGDYAGFLVGWMDWISTCASIGAISIVIGESVASVARADRRSASPDRDVGRRRRSRCCCCAAPKLGDLAQQSRVSPRRSRCSRSSSPCFVFAGRAHVAAAGDRVAATTPDVRGVHARRAVGDLRVRRLVRADLLLRRAGRSGATDPALDVLRAR